MHNEFFEELKQALNDENCENVDEVLAIYEAKYQQLLINNNEEESINCLGNPKTIASNYTKFSEPKPKNTNPLLGKSKKYILLNDIFYVTPCSIIGFLLTMVCAFCSIMVGILGGMYSVKAWELPQEYQAKAFLLAIIALIMCLGGIILSIVITKVIVKFLIKYSNERQQAIKEAIK